MCLLKLSLCLLPKKKKKKKNKQTTTLIIKPAAVKQPGTALWRNIKKTQSSTGIGFRGVCRKLSNWTQNEARRLSQGAGPLRPVLHQCPGPNLSCEQAVNGERFIFGYPSRVLIPLKQITVPKPNDKKDGYSSPFSQCPRSPFLPPS